MKHLNSNHFMLNFSICLLLFILLFFVSPCFASRTVSVGVFAGSPARQLSIDLIDSIAKQENWQVEYKIDSMNNCLAMLARGEIDVMTTLGYSLERDQFADYTQIPVLQRWSTLYLPLDSEISTMAQLQGKRVGILRKGATGRTFLEIIAKFDIDCQISRFDNFEAILKALENHTIDAGVIVNVIAADIVQKYQVKPSSVVFSPTSNYFAVPEGKNADLAATIDSYMKNWVRDADSVYYRSMNRWLLGKPIAESMPKWAYPAAAISFFVLMLLLLWAILLKRAVNAKTRQLQKSQILLSKLIDESPVGLTLCTIDGRYITANPVFLNIVGYRLEELQTMAIEDFLVKNEKRRELLLHHGDLAPFEEVIVNKQGIKVHVRIYATLIDDDGEKLIWSSVEDVTALRQMEAEKQALAAQLSQAQKMEAIGNLAGGIAHDFNNILAIIIGYTDLVMGKISDNDEFKQPLSLVLSAARRAKGLVRQILIFSRKGDNKKEALAISDTIFEASEMTRKTIPSSITVNVNIDDDIGMVMGDSTKIYQVVMNLLNNASQAMSDGMGIIDISLKKLEINSINGSHYPTVDMGEYAQLIIRDNGQGVANDDLERMFEPFFTTKQPGQGTGMGLAIVHGIIKDLGGAIFVTSEVGSGTRFEILFPLHSDLSKPEINAITSDVATGGAKHVLVIDDEPMLTELTRTTLIAHGYKVTAVSSPLDALALFNKQPDAYDLILTDQTMPEMTGDKLAVKILKIRPDVPVVVLTGLGGKLDQQYFLSIGVRCVLGKPIESIELLHELSRILNT